MIFEEIWWSSIWNSRKIGIVMDECKSKFCVEKWFWIIFLCGLLNSVQDEMYVWSGLFSTIFICTKVIQKESSNGLLKKKTYFQTIYIAIWCTYCVHYFSTCFHHCWGTCRSRVPVFVSLHRRRCRLQCKLHVNGFFDLVVVVEPLATKESFQMQEHMKITWR
jgi:hypothetical protein